MNQNQETKKKTMGRRKIEIKTIQNKNNLQVTFCKRRSGLFKKAGELALLTGAKIAIIMQSPSEKMFAFSNVDVDSVLNWFQTGSTPWFNTESSTCLESRREYEEAERRLRIEEKKNNELHGPENWWDKPVEYMDLNELEGYLEALKRLKDKVLGKVSEIEKLELVEIDGLSFEVGETSSNLTGFEDVNVNKYEDWERFLSEDMSNYDQGGDLISLEELMAQNVNTDACGSSSSNIINSPTEYQYTDNGYMEEFFNAQNGLKV